MLPEVEENFLLMVGHLNEAKVVLERGYKAIVPLRRR